MAFNLILIPFTIIAVYILLTIFKLLTVEKAMQSVLWLILMMVGVSFLLLMANAEILFAYQLMVYSGGIAVLLLFAGMLTNQDELFIDSSLLGFGITSRTQLAIVVVFMVDMIFLIFSAILDPAYRVGRLGDTTQTYAEADIVLRDFATYLWTDFVTVVILVGLLLLVAILGSVKLAIRETDLEELSEEYLAYLEATDEPTVLPGMENVEVNT